MEQHILADLHSHLHEKKLKPADWWKGAKAKKLSVVAITEHPQYDPKDAYLQLKATQPKGIILIPAFEAKTNVGDLIVFGEDESIYNYKELLKINVEVEKALKIIKKNKLVASFAHPYGFKTDSICEVIGEEKAKRLIKKYGVGVEYYNGLLGSANELVFGRGWIKNIYGALDFVDKNRATKALRLNKSTQRTKTQLEKLGEETLNRVKNGVLFSKNGKFITVGSDAHYPHSLGCGVLELKRKPKNEKEFLTMLVNKEIIYAGPNIYSKEPVDIVRRKEMIEGLTYMTKKKIFKKKNLPIRKITGKISLSKRIKTIKRITKKVRLKKIKPKLPKIKIKKRILGKIPGKKIVKTIRKRIGDLGK